MAFKLTNSPFLSIEEVSDPGDRFGKKAQRKINRSIKKARKANKKSNKCGFGAIVEGCRSIKAGQRFQSKFGGQGTSRQKAYRDGAYSASWMSDQHRGRR
jgi:hypothetical protein|tara:strand:+ start:98 stop:397 length:300 start_codon:yes stop_codon:yes gene_type:complete